MFLAGLNEKNEIRGFYPLDMLEYYAELPKDSIYIDDELHQYLLNGMFRVIGAIEDREIYTIDDKEMFERFIIESTSEPIDIVDPFKEKLDEVTAENKALKLALADLDTQRQQDKLDTQLAIAELTSTLMGGE